MEAVPLTEDAPPRSVLYPYQGLEEQVGPYAHEYEKILAERAVQATSGLDRTSLRLPKVCGPEDNGDLGTVYGFAAVPHWRWTHGHVRNVAEAIVVAATHPGGRNAVFNVGEELTPTMGERLAQLPTRASTPPESCHFDFGQPFTIDTSKIRCELGYRDIIDERTPMIEAACQADAGGLGEASQDAAPPA